MAVQLIRIAGPTDAMRRLADVPGLDFERTSATRLDDERWQVSGYATEEALAELEARGLSVESVVEPAALQEQRDELYGQIQRAPDEDE